MRGYTMTKDQYLARLRRIEGQVRGLQRMIDEDVYCIDVLQRISAVGGDQGDRTTRQVVTRPIRSAR